MDTDKHTGDKGQDRSGNPGASVPIRGSQLAASGAPAAAQDETTGLPGLRSWRGVYWVVFGCFLLWVFLLALLAKAFA